MILANNYVHEQKLNIKEGNLSQSEICLLATIQAVSKSMQGLSPYAAGKKAVASMYVAVKQCSCLHAEREILLNIFCIGKDAN